MDLSQPLSMGKQELRTLFANNIILIFNGLITYVKVTQNTQNPVDSLPLTPQLYQYNYPTSPYPILRSTTKAPLYLIAICGFFYKKYRDKNTNNL